MAVESRSIILKAEGVTKRFGSFVAVDHVNYHLYENEVAGILGSNGAGKTTFFNMLTGHSFPSEGTILYNGQNITKMAARERVAMGMMRTFQLTSTFDDLTVIDNLVLAFFRAHRKSSLWELLRNTTRQQHKNERVLETLHTFDLEKLSGRLVKHLGLGEKRRMEIAMAILAEPKVLLLDEPLAGLSESEIQGVLDVLRKQVGQQTLLIIEHQISHLTDFLQRRIVMHEGKIIAEGGYEECLHHPEVRKSYWQIDALADEAGSAVS